MNLCVSWGGPCGVPPPCNSGIELKVEKRCMKTTSGSGTSSDQELTIEELHRRFPSIFDLSQGAMRKITPHMQLMSVGLEDIEWIDGKMRFTSNCGYQTISQCEKKDVLSFTKEQVDRGIVSHMLPTQKGFFSQSLFIPKKSGRPRWVVDFRRLNTLCIA